MRPDTNPRGSTIGLARGRLVDERPAVVGGAAGEFDQELRDTRAAAAATSGSTPRS